MNTTITRRRIAVLAAAGAVAAGGIGLGASAAFAHPQTAGKSVEHIAIGGTESDQSVVLWGPVSTGGKDISHGQYDLLKLPGGTLRINHPDKQSHYRQHVDKRTCHYSATITGKYTITKGTGRYRGVTGHGSYHASIQAIAKRAKSGACDERKAPVANVFSVSGHGPVALPN